MVAVLCGNLVMGAGLLEGVPSGIGEDELARPRGLRIGNFEDPAEVGVRADVVRVTVGVFLA